MKMALPQSLVFRVLSHATIFYLFASDIDGPKLAQPKKSIWYFLKGWNNFKYILMHLIWTQEFNSNDKFKVLKDHNIIEDGKKNSYKNLSP